MEGVYIAPSSHILFCIHILYDGRRTPLFSPWVASERLRWHADEPMRYALSLYSRASNHRLRRYVVLQAIGQRRQRLGGICCLRRTRQTTSCPRSTYSSLA